MIGASQYNLTWDHFAELHQDKRTAFENLCRSLFLRNLCDAGTILHSDPNHPGVEVAPVYVRKEDCFISFQAKFFTTNINYAQIKESANKTVAYYKGGIDKIYIYCNKDITAESKSYKEIEKILSDASIDTILVTGQTILDQALEYSSVLATFFGLDNLDASWFDENLNLSLENLGNRYNSRFNIDTESQRKLELFLREETGIAYLNAKKANVIKELDNIRWRCESEEQKVIDIIKQKTQEIPDVESCSVGDALQWRRKLNLSCKKEISQLQRKQNELTGKLGSLSYKNNEYEKISEKLSVIERILLTLEELEVSESEKKCINSCVILVNGSMGTGKTQLLASTAKRLSANGRFVLLFLGQTFISSDSVEVQMMNSLLGLNSNQSLESLLNVLEEYGNSSNGNSVIFIDAINESRDRDIWRLGINRLKNTVEMFPHVRLVVSLRSGFEKLTLSENAIEEFTSQNGTIATICHRGLSDDSPAAVYEFLSASGIPFSPEYYLQSEMTNPLFLMWFCQTYTGEEKGLYELIEKVLDKADEEASKEAGNNEAYDVLQDLLYSIIEYNENPANGALTKNVLLGLQIWFTYGITKKVAYVKSIERFGLLVSYLRDGEELYYIGYNLLEDYLSAKRVFNMFDNEQSVRSYLVNNLLNLDESEKTLNQGNIDVFVMASSMYAIKYHEEYIDLVDSITDQWEKHNLLNRYFDSFAWRSTHITLDAFIDLATKYGATHRKVWDIFIENATKTQSELNALGLSKVLNCYEMNERDSIWTIEINGLTEYDRIISLAHYIEQGNEVKDLDDNKTMLLLTLFTWMLSASNRTLRDRISKTMIEILKSKFQLCLPLLKSFKDVNDPYIMQRLYGIVFGATMKRSTSFQESYKELTKWIFENVFMQDLVYPDILLRDYARLTVERYAYEFSDDIDVFDLSKIRPPYRSEPIPSVEVTDYGDKKYNEQGMFSLLYSMAFDIPVKKWGMYGDFGRYTFQSALSEFVDVDLENIYYYSLEYIFNTLGYTSELFGEYDSTTYGRSRNDLKKIERIGKKYQWITMYNVLARIADTHHVKDWDWNNKVGFLYQGPWYPYVRDFDPTLNVRYGENKEVPVIRLPEYSYEEFLDVEAKEEEIKQWVQNDSRVFLDFPSRLVLKDAEGNEWVCLYHYNEYKMLPENCEVSTIGLPKGEQHIWTLTTALLKPKMPAEDLIEKLTEVSSARSGRDIRNCYSLFSREYAWSPGYLAEFDNNEYEEASAFDDVIPAAVNVLWEEEFDASQDEATSFIIPAGIIIEKLRLHEKKYDGFYYDGDTLVAFDMILAGNEQHELVIRKDYLCKFLKETSSTLFWSVIGEKQFFRGQHSQIWQRREGDFVMREADFWGEIKIVDNK